MDTFIVTLVIVGTLALLAGTYLVLARQGHPEDASDHPGDERSLGPTGEPYPTGSRPGGPAAEGMNVPEPGDVTPGPKPTGEDREG